MTELPNHPSYDQLKPVEQCIVSRLNAFYTNKMKIELRKEYGYVPEWVSFTEKARRDVMLAIDGIESIITTLKNTEHPYHGVLATCKADVAQGLYRQTPR